MNIKRNGASVVAFDRVIFIFGGNNAYEGSLDSIERYAIEFDRWSMPRIKLKEPLHDSLAFNAGGSRVLILGGQNGTKPNSRFDIYDLTCECLGPEELKIQNGKMFIPSCYDPSTGLINCFLGYGDSFITHAQKQLKTLICTCRSVSFSDNAVCSDDISAANRDK